MGKGLDKFLNMMRLNDDNYDDDYEDTYEDDYDNEYDDYEEEAPAPKKRSAFRKSAAVSHTEPAQEKDRAAATSILPKGNGSYSSRNNTNKIVSINKPSRPSGMEVSIQKPATFEDSRSICDELMAGKAAVVNLEGIDVEVAQRIIDFVSGACYSMSGNIRKVSHYIFIVTPEGIDISGNMESVFTSGNHSNSNVPTFHLNI